MNRARIGITWEGQEVTIHQDLHRAPAGVQRVVLATLEHRLAKAAEPAEPEPKDLPIHPLYPELQRLVHAARESWARHGAALVRRVVQLRDEGRLIPLDASTEPLLRELFRDHQVGLIVEMTGAHEDAGRVRRLVREGMVDPDYAERAPLAISYRLGRGLEALHAPRIPKQRAPSAAIAEALRQANAVHLTAADHAALAYVQHRGADFMRITIERAQGNMARTLRADEVARVRGAVHSQLAAGGGVRDVRAALTEAVVGTAITNDLERVARTEVASAQVWGAFETLRVKHAGTPNPDPLIYRITDGYACTHCRRIYGVGAGVKPYRLSYVEQRTLDGGNFGVKAANWGPVAEATHPNCACGPWHTYDAAKLSDVQEAADWIAQHLG